MPLFAVVHESAFGRLKWKAGFVSTGSRASGSLAIFTSRTILGQGDQRLHCGCDPSGQVQVLFQISDLFLGAGGCWPLSIALSMGWSLLTIQ